MKKEYEHAKEMSEWSKKLIKTTFWPFLFLSVVIFFVGLAENKGELTGALLGESINPLLYGVIFIILDVILYAYWSNKEKKLAQELDKKSRMKKGGK